MNNLEALVYGDTIDSEKHIRGGEGMDMLVRHSRNYSFSLPRFSPG